MSMLIFSTALSSVAAEEKEYAVNKFYSYNQKLICISHRGDTASYPENSIEAVCSALEKGADFVSVSLNKTKDGVYYLCERASMGNVINAPYESLSDINSQDIGNYRLYDIYGNLTDLKLASLEELLKSTDVKDGIILDVLSSDKDSVYDVLLKNNALDRILVRIEDNASELVEWAKSKEKKVNIIVVYGGNIIFSTISAINVFTNAGMPAVQYDSGNYFNVAYGEFFTNRYLPAENVRAVAATYSADLCGQRGDNTDGWNELINKGYSVIETNNVESFVAYRTEIERILKSIVELTDKALQVDTAKYSEVSVSNLQKAILNAKAIGSATVVSLDAAQQAYSGLLLALGDMQVSAGEVNTKGALNVTEGKIVAVVTVGAALLAGQIYIYKMRKSKEKN